MMRSGRSQAMLGSLKTSLKKLSMSTGIYRKKSFLNAFYGY